MTYLYGLEHASKDFTKAKSFGKNTFTNAFPLALTQYIAIEKQLPIPVIKAASGNAGRATTEHVLTPWTDIISVDPRNARFDFEASFTPYKQFANAQGINPSDVVVRDNNTGEPLHPLELKLVVVPNSGSSHLPREQQACEIVSRPPTVEQIAYSIAYGFTSARRYEMQTILQSALGLPNDYEWRNVDFMVNKLPDIVRATEAIISTGLDVQRPLIMVAIWRSQGQKPMLDENAFDVFIWTELAFVELYLGSVRSTYLDEHGNVRPEILAKETKSITRPARTLIWLIRSLWDYTTQRILDFPRIQRDTAYGAQTDKAASFTNSARDIMMSDEYLYPRVYANEIDKIFLPEARDFLLPERRLDASLSLRFALEKLHSGEDWNEQQASVLRPADALEDQRSVSETRAIQSRTP